MKAVFALAVLCGFIALTLTEDCDPRHFCRHVSCPEADYEVGCDHNECTCIKVIKCLSNDACKQLECDFDTHCVDGNCTCGFAFPGGHGFGHHGN